MLIKCPESCSKYNIKLDCHTKADENSCLDSKIFNECPVSCKKQCTTMANNNKCSDPNVSKNCIDACKSKDKAIDCEQKALQGRCTNQIIENECPVSCQSQNTSSYCNINLNNADEAECNDPINLKTCNMTCTKKKNECNEWASAGKCSDPNISNKCSIACKPFLDECNEWANAGKCLEPDVSNKCSIACKDKNKLNNCEKLTDEGHCTFNSDYMLLNCPESCIKDRITNCSNLINASWPGDCDPLKYNNKNYYDKNYQLRKDCPKSCPKIIPSKKNIDQECWTKVRMQENPCSRNNEESIWLKNNCPESCLYMSNMTKEKESMETGCYWQANESSCNDIWNNNVRDKCPITCAKFIPSK